MKAFSLWRTFVALFVVILALYWGVPTHAQSSDPTDPWRYLPLQVGNVWEYTLVIKEFNGSTCDTEVVGRERWRVVEEVVVESQRYAVLNIQSNSSTESRDELVRFDTLALRGVRRTADGSEEGWPGNISCRLNAPFGVTVECDEDEFATTYPSDWIDVRVNGETQRRRAKTFTRSRFAVGYIADVGMRFAGEYPNECTYEVSSLNFARVGDIEYGTERFPVATEDGAPEERALTLSVYPNPSRGEATVRFSLDAPQRVTLAVYDVLGRRVLAAELGARQSGETVHRLDAAALPAGLYVVRLTGEAGASATARIVRH